jgi:hypothetical protein
MLAQLVPLILPRSLAWLLLALPAIPLAGRDLARAVTTERSLRRVLGPGIGLAIWLLLVHFGGRLTGSLTRGLWMACLAMVLGVVGHRLARRAGPRWTTTVLGRGVGKGALLAALVTAAPIALMAFAWAFHDEYMYAGHLAITSEILNDAYPPRHPTFPAFELRYHYGFDLLTACITAIFRLPPDTAMDWAAVSLWIYSALLLHTIGEIWMGRGRGFLAVVMTLFVGGIPVCMNGQPFELKELLTCTIERAWTLPPFTSTFFQHPWSLGLPFALAAILIVTAREHQRPFLRLVLLWVLLSALSLSESVLFVTVTPSLVAAETWFLWRHRKARPSAYLGILAAGLATLVVARLAGGFFAPSPAPGRPSAFYFELGVIPGLGPSLRWLAQSFGLVAPLAAVGVFLLPARARVLVALLITGSVGVLCTIHYRDYPFDMVKFGTVASLAMGLAAARAVAGLLPKRHGISFPRRLARLVPVIAIVLAATSGGLAYALFIPVFPTQANKLFNRTCRGMARDDLRAAAYLRGEVKPGELVFRREGPAVRYVQWAGLPVPWIDWATYAFGFPEEMIRARLDLVKSLPSEPTRYLDQGIRWFVLEPDDKRLIGLADTWIAQKKAREVKRFGNLRIVALEEARAALPIR